MKIQVGKYTINSDQFCLWITQPKTAKKKDGTEYESEERVAGYSANFQQLLDSFASRKIRGSEARTAEQLLKDLAGIECDIQGIISAVNKNAVKKEVE